MKTAGNLVVLGSINADHVLNLETFPTPGETVTGNQYQVAFGGKGANQAVAAGRSGANIAFIACTGDDDTGERVRKQLASDNIDIAPVSVVAGESTGVALIFVNAEGENVIGIHAGANAALTTECVEAQRGIIAGAEALLMQLESPVESVLATAKIAHENHTSVVLNPAPARVLSDELLALVEEMNRREDVDGILVQLPLPEGLDSRAVLEAIRPEKDVDAFHPENVGRLMLGLPRFLPCTPAGIMALLRAYGISPAGKHCVVVGRSNIVGKPMALLLLAEDATVTVCHSRTPDLAEQCRRADILISAVGRRGLITSDMVKPGAVVVDVAMNRNEEGKLCGDVDFAAVAEKAAYITPVPGGVGPMTRAMLMENTVSASRRRQRKED